MDPIFTEGGLDVVEVGPVVSVLGDRRRHHRWI